MEIEDKIYQLKKLAKLKKYGVITKAEFLQEKEKILSLESINAQNHKKITNLFIWLLSLLPFILSVILNTQNIANDSYESIIIFFILNSLLCEIDSANVQKKYDIKVDVWYIFLVPIYLYKRSEIVKDTKAYFWIWIICFCLYCL